MQQEKVLQTLRDQKETLQAKYDVTHLGIFGSVARGQTDENSDVDIIVEMPPDLFQMVHMKEDLEQLFNRSIDLVRYHENLSPFLKSRLDNEAIYI